MKNVNLVKKCTNKNSEAYFACPDTDFIIIIVYKSLMKWTFSYVVGECIYCCNLFKVVWWRCIRNL